MNEKSAYLCIRFREGKWLSDDMMNESGSDPPDWPSILPCNVAREREKLSGKISEKFFRKNLEKICTVKINHLSLHPLSLQN